LAGVTLLGFLAVPNWASGADLSLPVTGNLLGNVLDANGTPQMGATVLLFNKYQRRVGKTLTAPDGRFAFANLPADFYSVQVSLASFLPVSRDKVPVKPGVDSILQIHLATLFSSIEVTYSLPTQAMTDDWKWVLRSSAAIRPITRFLPVDLSASAELDPQKHGLHPRIFSGTHAMVSVSGGDGGLIDSDSAGTDLGTGFALSTNVMGKNQVQLAGTYGQSGLAGPSAMGLCAIYSRNADAGLLNNPPEVTLTISQLGRVGPQSANGQFSEGTGAGSPIPELRTMSLSFYNTADPLDNVHIEYGMTGESVDYLQHTSRISPFARITVGIGRVGQIVAAYSDGGRPDELNAHQQQSQSAAEVRSQNEDLIGAVNALARLPQISVREGQLELQRTENYEAGFTRVSGSRTYAASAFFEKVTNGRMNVDGDLSLLDSNDLLSDGVSRTSTYNIGSYRQHGYLTSVDQRLKDTIDVAIAYGRMGGFTGDPMGLGSDSENQRRFLNSGTYNIASANVKAVSPVTGTRILANYGWVDDRAVVPSHVFSTQNTYVTPGLNVLVRQPLPSFFGMPGRLELTADLRNLLAQGYIPLEAGDGRRLLIVQAPRSIRGGLNFVF
jgi:hypothetical protein